MSLLNLNKNNHLGKKAPLKIKKCNRNLLGKGIESSYPKLKSRINQCIQIISKRRLALLKI